jgi:hypothetical protein
MWHWHDARDPRDKPGRVSAENDSVERMARGHSLTPKISPILSESLGDHFLRDASPAEEDLGDIAVRVIERVNTNGRRTVMMYRLKSMHRA